MQFPIVEWKSLLFLAEGRISPYTCYKERKAENGRKAVHHPGVGWVWNRGRMSALQYLSYSGEASPKRHFGPLHDGARHPGRDQPAGLLPPSPGHDGPPGGEAPLCPPASNAGRGTAAGIGKPEDWRPPTGQAVGGLLPLSAAGTVYGSHGGEYSPLLGSGAPVPGGVCPAGQPLSGTWVAASYSGKRPLGQGVPPGSCRGIGSLHGQIGKGDWGILFLF